MSIEAGAEKRRGKRVIGERRTGTISQTPMMVKEAYTIEEAFNLFLRVKEAENVKPRTRKEYDVQYRYFTEWFDGYAPNVTCIQEITTSMIRDYIHYLAYERTKYEGNPYKKDEYKQEKGLSPYTVNIRIRFLKSWFNVLVKERILPSSPMQTIKLMKVDEDTKEPLTEEEVRLLLKQPNQRLYAQYRDYVMMTLFIDSGMRVNEVCALDVDDIDFKSRYIHLPATKNKNRKTRIIPLSSETIRLILELINETKQYFDTNAVFVSNFGERLTIDAIRSSLYKYAKKAGIKKTVSPHSFRRFYAKQCSLNGMDIFTLQRTLGHADISTTRKYIQLEKEDLIRQHNLYSPLQRIRNRK